MSQLAMALRAPASRGRREPVRPGGFGAAVGRSRAAAESSIVDGLDAIDLLPATAAIFESAGRLSPTDLRSLDAIHLATALDLADDCDGIITYDIRLTEASQAHGLAVLAPR